VSKFTEHCVKDGEAFLEKNKGQLKLDTKARRSLPTKGKQKYLVYTLKPTNNCIKQVKGSSSQIKFV